MQNAENKAVAVSEPAHPQELPQAPKIGWYLLVAIIQGSQRWDSRGVDGDNAPPAGDIQRLKGALFLVPTKLSAAAGSRRGIFCFAEKMLVIVKSVKFKWCMYLLSTRCNP